MPQTQPRPKVSAPEALRLLEQAYAYYTPSRTLETGKPEAGEYYDYCAT